MKKDKKLNINNMLALTISDIDIFLLKENDQETDKKKLFTVHEIRKQLEISFAKSAFVMQSLGYDINRPIMRMGEPPISKDSIITGVNFIQENFKN